MMLRTPQQRKAMCPSCPVARVADLLGDPCSLLIIRDLIAKPCRFGELQESLSGISSRTLTNKLKNLEKEGLISRREFSGKPPCAKYSVTKKGAAFQTVIESMRKYGKKYL